MKYWTKAVLPVAVLLVAGTAQGETRLTFKSAKTGTSYYQMAVELAETVRSASGGEFVMTVEESQGSVQNVMEVRALLWLPPVVQEAFDPISV